MAFTATYLGTRTRVFDLSLVVCLSVCPSVCPSVSLSVCVCVSLSLCLSLSLVLCLSVCLSVSVCLTLPPCPTFSPSLCVPHLPPPFSPSRLFVLMLCLFRPAVRYQCSTVTFLCSPWQPFVRRQLTQTPPPPPPHRLPSHKQHSDLPSPSVRQRKPRHSADAWREVFIHWAEIQVEWESDS